MSATALPWEAQPGESARAFAAFCLYRDLVPSERSIDRAYEKSTGHPLPEGRRAPGYWTNWSTAQKWAHRAAAWDLEMDRRRREAAAAAEVEEVRQMRKRHIRQALRLQTRALEGLEKLAVDDLSGFAVTRMLVEGVKIERQARGEPDVVAETRNINVPNPSESDPLHIDPNTLTDEELDFFERVLERQRARAEAAPPPAE